MGLLENLDESIEALMPPEQAQIRRENRMADDAKRVQLRKLIVIECAYSIEYSTAAIRSQFGSPTDIEAAIEHLQAALKAARELDK